MRIPENEQKTTYITLAIALHSLVSEESIKMLLLDRLTNKLIRVLKIVLAYAQSNIHFI